MESFFSFSSANNCFHTDKNSLPFGQLIVRKNLCFDTGYQIEVNLVNTTPFSCGYDDGLHYLPEDAIQILRQDNPNAILSIIIMHHSPDWFVFAQKKELENLIAQRCSMAFFGHEHITGVEHICYDNDGRIIKQAGGAWWQQSSPLISEYHLSLFDSETLDYSIKEFSWNQDYEAFICKGSSQYKLMLKPLNRKGLICQESYMKALMADKKYAISQSISDYFIFPSLHTCPSKDYLKGQNIRRWKTLFPL